MQRPKYFDRLAVVHDVRPLVLRRLSLLLSEPAAAVLGKVEALDGKQQG